MAKILLVDDDPLLIRMYQTKLESDGYTVETGNNGEEAVLKATTFGPDLILCDIMMPKMNGLDALKKLKGDEATKEIPVIMLSNVSGSNEDTNKALELGAATYMVKSSYTPKEVVQKVKEILSATVHEIPKVEVAIKPDDNKS